MPGSRFWVCALNALQNSMMLRPRWPKAGPIGGDGLALPAGTCSLIMPTIFFAILFPHPPRRRPGPMPPSLRPLNPGSRLSPGCSPRLRRGSHLLDLRIFELDRRRPAEDRHRDLDPRLLVVDLLDDAVERGERPVGDAHLLADLEGDRGLRPLDAFLDLPHDPRRLVLADRRGAAAAAEKAGDLGGVLDEMPGLVVEVHLDQDVAREELALRADLGATLDFDHLF